MFSSVSFPHTRGVTIGVGIACKYTDARSSSQSAGGTRLFVRRMKKEEDNNNIINYNNLIRTHARTYTPLDVYIYMKDDDFQKKILGHLRSASYEKNI